MVHFLNKCAFAIIFTIIVSVNSGALSSLGLQSALYRVPGLGNRPLIIKTYPAIENFQSDLYDVYMEPYTYDLRSVSAVAVIKGDGDTRGELIFVQRHPPTGPVLIRGNITGLPPGKHGLHIHDAGDLRNGCENLGDHFNPYLMQHGGPKDSLRHVGDLGNVEVGENGAVEVNIFDTLLALSSAPRGIVGRAIAVSINLDDYGKGGTTESVKNGSSGKSIACGVISYIRRK